MSYVPSTYWPGSNIEKSTDNAFTQRLAAVFSTDPQEIAKATLHRKGSAMPAATGVPMMGNLSKRAQRQLSNKSSGITVGKSDIERSRRISKASI